MDGGAGEKGTEMASRRLAPRLCVARGEGETLPQPEAPLHDGDGDGEALAARDGDTADLDGEREGEALAARDGDTPV